MTSRRFWLREMFAALLTGTMLSWLACIICAIFPQDMTYDCTVMGYDDELDAEVTCHRFSNRGSTFYEIWLYFDSDDAPSVILDSGAQEPNDDFDDEPWYLFDDSWPVVKHDIHRLHNKYKEYKAPLRDSYFLKQCGWPFIQASNAYMFNWDAIRESDIFIITGGIDVSSVAGSFMYENIMAALPRVVPLTIKWNGMISNVLFYSVITLGIRLGWREIRSQNRRRRNRCCCCGYDMRGTTESYCPECGNERSNQ